VATPVPEATLSPAATVVLLRPAAGGLEALLTRRPTTMRFAPDLHVFPGGRIEPDETAVAAAVRETREETGIELSPVALVAIGRWVTPAGLASRFDARFFAAVVGPAADVDGPNEEVASWEWVRPRAALDRFAAGELLLWPPTLVTLQQLEGIADEATLRSTFQPPGERQRAVTVERIDDDRQRIDGGWAGGVEGRPWSGWILGRSRWVVVNPADPTGETLAAVVSAADASGAGLDGVVVTSLEPEHHAGASLFSVGLGLPLATPPGVPRIAREPHLELDDGAVLPFGDVETRVHVERPTTAPRGGVGHARWAGGFSRLRLEGGGGWALG
jgi:8-oxo-dGTP pyrophosphatase MutT (NUDIX family)